MPDRETVIDKLNDMADYLLTKSYSDLLARDFYETVGYAIVLLKEQDEQIRIKTENFNRLVAKIGVMPKIVRCKDCKHMRHLEWLDDETGKAIVCDKHVYSGGHNEEFFCADGERR